MNLSFEKTVFYAEKTGKKREECGHFRKYDCFFSECLVFFYRDVII